MKNTNLFYIVNSEPDICTCPIEICGVSWCAAKDCSFYASLCPQSTSQPLQSLQSQEDLHVEMGISNDT
ncbi:18637_t:CDS:2 [Dentiscutata erythropus]|uniref:18637_t:CDS:1 n=1 Tax=Dentiscutata erythropus TaxID=1348616 RepID=A0A9N9GTN3_9GLOM|nr:18637_t:CDS:2 [Dentiscutata erythropus]